MGAVPLTFGHTISDEDDDDNNNNINKRFNLDELVRKLFNQEIAS